MIAEEIIWEKMPKGGFTIVRPTQIWGKYHPRFPDEMWKYIKERKYLHPSGKIVRSYGYVDNIGIMLANIATCNFSDLNEKIFYLSDKPIDSYEWVNSFSRNLCGKNVRVIPRFLLKTFGALGELVNIVGMRSPIDMGRVFRMTTNYVVPLEQTFKILGESKYPLNEGVSEVSEWLLREKWL